MKVTRYVFFWLSPKTKEAIKSYFKPILVWLSELECRLAKSWVFNAHKRLKYVTWDIRPEPEYFDHDMDLFWNWPRTRISFWIERGVFGSMTLKGGDALDLACGDGFMTRNFYSLRAKNVIACDYDKSALKTAQKKNSAPNITYVYCDLRKEMPKGKFSNVFFDTAIEHFSAKEIQFIMTNIKERLTADGILSGSTLAERDEHDHSSSTPGWHNHEIVFENKEDLKRHLQPFFKNVVVFETIFPQRHSLYFWASDGALPSIN